MMQHRVRTIALLAVLTVLASSCERMSVGPEIAGELRRGRAYAATLVEEARAVPATQIPASAAISLGYLERQRLGLGSPFRLIAYALDDPRLADSTRRLLAWSLLARTLDGKGDQVNPVVLDSLENPLSPDGTVDGREHLHLIESAVHDTHDPRAGELAVRLAYAIAASAREVRATAPLVTARVAALVRDRKLASADARDLLREAWRRDDDPLVMVGIWRAERRLRVERPPMERFPADAELEAMELAPRLAEQIRSLEPKHDDGDAATMPAGREPLSLLGNAALRLAALARAANVPPETPVVVPISSYRSELVHGAGLTRAERGGRYRFVSRARNEESLAAAYALVERQAPGLSVERSTLAAAVALRAYAQETPWFPGDGGPTARELADRFGVGPVTFDPDTPEAWKPYYRAMLASALGDIQRVVPSLHLDGLHVHFGESPMRNMALALHDPKRRVIYLPLATGAGTLAHELAHDIDWQAARTRYAVRGDYATDRAVRDARGGRLAASMRGLTAASLTAAAARESREPLSSRPTEVFARSVDWFVAVALAREGRLNGYLSSVQDDLLTGYVAVTPPDVTGEAGSALVSILDDVAPPAPSLRGWFLTRYGPGRALTPYDLVRRVLEAPLDPVGDTTNNGASDTTAAPAATLVQLVAPVVRARDAALVLVGARSCRPGGGPDDARLTEARQRLVELAAQARARGIVHDRGTMLLAEEAWRWAAIAPYAAAQPFLLVNALRPALEGDIAERAELLDTILPRPSAAVLDGVGCSRAMPRDADS
jgi:hypothetical protein